MKRTLSVLVENKPGVLSKVAGLFSRRGFNIDSLAVGVTEDETTSRMTIVIDGNDYIVEQITKQLNKMIDVIRVKELENWTFITRELALVKVRAEQENRNEILQLVQMFGGKVSDVSPKSIVIELSANTEKIESLVAMLKQYGIIESVRTGAIAVEKGEKKITKG